jgi:putative ABC transport system permease protein
VIIRGLVNTRQDMSRVEAIHIDGAVVAFTVGLVFLCAVFAGLISSVSATGSGVLSALQESSRSHSGGQARAKLRKMLLSLEVGLTVVLLITAGLLLKSYQHLRSSDLGCITQNVLTMRFSLPKAQYPQPAQRTEFFDALLTRVRSLPGVRAAGLSTAVPGQGYMGDRDFLIAEHPPLPLSQGQFAISRWVGPAYFATLEIPFLRGQPFQQDQKLDRAMKAIVSESFARRYLPGEDPVGKHLLTLGKQPYEIVGVVGDTRFLIGQPAEPIMYFPLYSGRETDATLAVRSSQDVSMLALPIQQIVQQLDRDLPVADVVTMEQLIGKTTVDAGFDAMLLLAFAVLSLILAAVGLFGVLSYLVTQRSTEIGIRLALGAQRETVLALVLRDGLRPAFVGVALGLIGSVVAAQLVRSMLYGVRPFDPMVFLAVVVVLLLVSGGACIVPAWRASRLDPLMALREE